MMNYLFTKTPLLFFVQSFWSDEAFSYVMSKNSILHILPLTAQDFNPPLYYILLHFWMMIFGSSEIVLRTLSLVFYGLTVYLAYDILTQICKLGKFRSLFYLILFLINPLLIYYAFEARMYSMVTFFVTLSFYSFYFKKKKLFAFAAIGGMYTHYFMIFALFTQFVWSILYRKPKEKILSLARPFILPALAMVPWFIFVLRQKKFSSGFWIPKPVFKDILYLPSVLYTGFEKDFAYYNDGKKDYTGLMTQILVIILAIIAIYLVKNVYLKEKKFRLSPVAGYLFLWTFIPTVIVLISSFYLTPTYLPRYIMFSTVGLLLFIIYALESFNARPRILALFILLYLTNKYQTVNLKYREKGRFAEKAHEIQYLMKKDDLVYVSDERDFHTAIYYFGENPVYIYGKTYDDIPSYVGKVLIPKTRLTNVLPFLPKKAFVIKHNNGYEIRSQM